MAADRRQRTVAVPPGDLEAVLALMASGELAVHTERISFDDIPAGIERLAAGTITGRLVATFD